MFEITMLFIGFGSLVLSLVLGFKAYDRWVEKKNAENRDEGVARRNPPSPVRVPVVKFPKKTKKKLTKTRRTR